MWWGLGCALAAAIAYGLASVLQASAAGSDTSTDVSASGLVRIVTQWRFLVGIGLDVAGFALQLAALQVLPLFLVQSALAASLAVTAIAARSLGARLGRREWFAVGAVCVGLGLVGASASSEDTAQVGHRFQLALIGAVVLLGIARMSSRVVPRRFRAPFLGLVAGLGFGVVAISGRTIPSLRPADLVTEPATYIAAVSGAMAMLCYAAALQRGGVTTATAMLVVGETVFPALVGLLALGDRPRPGYTVTAIGGFVLAVTAALMLARFGEPQRAAVSPAAGSPPSRGSSASPGPGQCGPDGAAPGGARSSAGSPSAPSRRPTGRPRSGRG
jgi:drug/metabolite transporter (DMT)-like permease